MPPSGCVLVLNVLPCSFTLLVSACTAGYFKWFFCQIVSFGWHLLHSAAELFMQEQTNTGEAMTWEKALMKEVIN